MMGRRGRLCGAGLLGIGLASVSPFAEAAPQRKDQGPLFTQVDTGQGAAATARALAVKGQCAKALDFYDQALHSSIDMTLRRDRGLCHEALGHPFPAMDDYRAYLTVTPDAPDSADIQARLERLELQTGTGGPSANPPSQKSSEDVPDEAALADETTPGTTDDGKRKKSNKKTYDEEESTYHKYDRAAASALRLGSGAIFGVYSDFRGTEYGGTTTPSVEVGATVRWAFDRFNSLYGQIGYVSYLPGGVDTLGTSGPDYGGLALGFGYEFRLRLDEFATNSLLFGALVEYQRVTESELGTTANLMIPEAKVGYRLVLGYGFGIEATGDIGTTLVLASGGGAEGVIFGGSLAFLLTF